MAAAFSEKEKASIRQALISAARKYAQTIGMKRTTVDMLAAEAGISKGAFYGFYESKEHLFLDMLEAWHEEIESHARAVLEGCASADPKQRAGMMLKEALRLTAGQSLHRFMREDAPVLLRKLPPELLEKQYKNDDELILNLMEKAGITLSIPRETAVGIIRIMFHSLLLVDQTGAAYADALSVLVDCCCRQLIVG
ncbi:MAG: TetR/AcrR family transcriptional regulator [Clostridia bacterium]|nr:TetR/AcrR family transcriptional regulator [Clostridia bacterium]